MEGEGNEFIAAANKAGSIPTSCGVAVFQPPSGNCATLGNGGFGSNVLASARGVTRAISPAEYRNVTTQSTAASTRESFEFFLSVLNA
jgi:hypothetical protein